MMIARGIARRVGLRFLYRLSLLLLLLPLMATAPDAARADDNSDAANLAVQIFVAGGQAVGLPITQDEAALVTQLVSCGVAGQSNIGNCAKGAAVGAVLQQAGVTDPTITGAVTCLVNTADPAGCAVKAAAVLANLPPDAQPAVSCMLGGGNVLDCGKKVAEGMVLDKIPPSLQGPAKCAIEGGNVQGCVTTFITNQVVSTLPPSLQDAAGKVVGCIAGNTDVAGCIAKAAVSSVTAGTPVAALANCAQAAGANLTQCAANFAAANLPPVPGASASTNAAVSAIVGCVGAKDFATCAQKPAIAGAESVATQALTPVEQKAISDAMGLINQLKPGAPKGLSATASSGSIATLQDIINIADGIKNKNWAEVVAAAGPELAIAASNVLLSIFLTPPVAGLLSPAVTAMIQNDAAAAGLALQAISNGDPVGLAQVIFTWYETNLINEPCALIGNNDVGNTICGGLSDTIKTISDAGGDLAKKILGLGKDVLQFFGVWSTVDGIVTGAWNDLTSAVGDVEHWLGIAHSNPPPSWTQPADCANFSMSDYFANNYGVCIASDAANSHASGGLNDSYAGTKALNAACTAAVGRCLPPDKQLNAAAMCAAMGAQLAVAGDQVASAMGKAADLANTIGLSTWVAAQFKSATGNNFGGGSIDFCSPTYWASSQQAYSNSSSCAAFVDKQFPVAPSCTMAVAGDGGQGACETSLDVFNSATNSGAGQIKTSLAGPDSSYCKAQQAWQSAHDCRWVPEKVDMKSPDGKVIAQLDTNKFVCKPDWQQVAGLPWMPIIPKPPTFGPRPSWANLGPGAIFNPPKLPVSSSGSNGSVPFNPKLPIGGLPNFPVSSSGFNPITPNNPKLPPPIVIVLPKGGVGGGQGGSGGSSGISETNSCSGNSPAAGCPPQSGAPKKPPPILGATKGGNSGGSSGISMVNGCSGNSPAAGCPTTPSPTRPNTTPPKPTTTVKGNSGGSSGISMVNGASGNAPTVKVLNNSTISRTKNAARTITIAPVRPSISVTNTQRSPGLGSSGANTVRSPAFSSSGTNSAMDRLGGGSIGGVSGGGGGSAARRPGTSFGTGSNTFKTMPVTPRNDPNDLHVH